MAKTRRKPINVPEPLYERIVKLAEEFQTAYEAGRTTRVQPADNMDGCTVPLHQIVKIAIDDLESHRIRSRKRNTTQEPTE